MVKEQISENPVYVIHPEGDPGARNRTVHRNLLLLVNDLPVDGPTQPTDTALIPPQRQKQPQQRAESADNNMTDTDDEDEGTGGYWLRTPVIRMESDRSGRGRLTATGGGQMSVPKPFPPATVPVHTSKKPSMTHEEHSNAVPMRGTEPMDAYLPDETNLPERDDTHTDETNLPERDDTHTVETNLPGKDNIHTDETNLPEREHKQNFPAEEREVELVVDGLQMNEQHDVVHLPQPGEDEQNDHAEQVQVDRLSSPLKRTVPAEDEHGQVRRSARERRPRPTFTYESLGQPSIQTHVGSTSSQTSSISLPFMPHMTRQFLIPTPYMPQMYMPYTYYMPVTTQVY